MASSLPSPLGLLAFINQPHERANEDLAIGYFRSLFGESFQRQKEARKADGYVPGGFVLELKGKTSDWFAGLFQALAYHNEGLDFAQVVIAAHAFLAVWQVSDIPTELRLEIAAAGGPPNRVGRRLARQHAALRADLLRRACWNGNDLSTPLFQGRADIATERMSSFVATLRGGRRVRQRVSLKNFLKTLKEMTVYFDPAKTISPIRAFYSMIYAWDASSILHVSAKAPDQATLGGEIIRYLKPSARVAFKDFVEARCIALDEGASFDDFFARYDEALDAIDPEFRRQHGIFFTDLHLCKLAMWIAKQHIPNLGQDYLVIDPACGSGNLVSNWRSPLDLRHKVISEIEPELLFAVEQRLKGDLWHNGRFTVVPEVSEGRGLNFLDRSATDYLDELRTALSKKGHAPDKPLAFLCNPPFRSDDEQTAESVPYLVHPTVTALTGQDGANERYCCFLAQMKLICESARSSGLPGESLLLLFTKSAWLTNRSIFRQLRSEMAGVFEDVAGILVDGSEFFDVRGKWPVAFTIWRYKGPEADLNAERTITLSDLTWLSKKDLKALPWSDSDAADRACRALIDDVRTLPASLGHNRRSIRVWSGQAMVDFKRDRRRSESEQAIVGGLPIGDRRHINKKAYGEKDGAFVGFMDDLTPCRVRRAAPGKPWFRLNSQFMDVKKNRCFSGPPTHCGYCASDVTTARKLFVWFALARTFVQKPYPMWVDAEDLWEPRIPQKIKAQIFALSAAIVFAENECVETYFPAHNPVYGAPEVYVSNPLTSLDRDSFWSKEIEPSLDLRESPAAAGLTEAVNNVFSAWDVYLGPRKDMPISYSATYHADQRSLTRRAGILQIRDYAKQNEILAILSPLANLATALREAKAEFYSLLLAKSGLNYFEASEQVPVRIELPARSAFDKIAARRLVVAGMIVKELHEERHFGRTKLAKVFYLADQHAALTLDTSYIREAAGPLDARALYHERVGIEALAHKHGLFRSFERGHMTRYRPSPKLDCIKEAADIYLEGKTNKISRVIELCRSLTTDQTEIIATLYACWNDMLDETTPSDEEIVADFLVHWHPKKSRFSRPRLFKALDWMRERSLVPSGKEPKTRAKAVG